MQVKALSRQDSLHLTDEGDCLFHSRLQGTIRDGGDWQPNKEFTKNIRKEQDSQFVHLATWPSQNLVYPVNCVLSGRAF